VFPADSGPSLSFLILLPQFQNESLCKTFVFKNEFDLHENELIEVTNFHMNGFAGLLILSRVQRQKATRKCPIFDILLDSFISGLPSSESIV